MKRIDILYVLIGILYLIVGMVLGIVMGIRGDFQLAAVHAHVNLVGFVSHCMFGVIHRAWPSLRASALAVAQFWFFVLGTPVYLVGITIAILMSNIVLAATGAIAILIGALLFLVMIVRAMNPGSVNN
jgi:hypothetical protein